MALLPINGVFIIKKCYFLILLVALLCLTGCACKHEWTEADCLVQKTCTKCGITEGETLGHTFAPADCENPEACTRCGATQGEALGHTWAEASCAAPETCGVCGETQGETLEHTMSKWEIDGEEMSRECEVCGFAETVAVDREAYVWDHLVGHWDPYIVYMGNDGYWATILGNESVGLCVKITEEGKITLIDGNTVKEGTVSFQKYEDGFHYVELAMEGAEEPWTGILDD